LADALKCISDIDQPEEIQDPTYEEHWTNMEKTVNGFFKCLLAQSIEKVPKDGFCGPGTSDDTKD